MNDGGKAWVASRYKGLSTGLKMLLFLTLGLLPLGIVAVLATVDSARETRAKSRLKTEAVLMLSAQRVSSAVGRGAITLRAASAAIAESGSGKRPCEATLARISRLQETPGRFALFGPGNTLRCATPGFAPAPVPRPGTVNSVIGISPDGNLLRFFLFDDEGQIEGAGEFTRGTLAALTAPSRQLGEYHLEMAQGSNVMRLRTTDGGGPFARQVALSAPLAGGRMELRIRAPAPPITASELLMILLPVMMWAGAAVIGWLIVDRLLLRPLARMQRAVSAYKPGDQGLDLPDLKGPAREIGELGEAFDKVTRTVARHEAELEAAVDRQTRLVREVHHRVKNNLQVVASLLNLHARGVSNEEVAAAYASIQRRVDALAVVHRNHYAELEENRGVALKSLISELAANLRATAPASAAHMHIRINIEPFYVTQDVAVSVGFLITELVEFAMFCDAAHVSISLEEASPVTARLAIESDSLAGDIDCDPKLFERFDRIVTGLSRQLRSSLDKDSEIGRYAINVAVVDRAER